MQYLHANASIGLMYGFSYLSVLARLPGKHHTGSEWGQSSAQCGRKPARNNKSCFTRCTLTEVTGESGKISCTIFQASMHTAHQDTVSELGETQVQWL